MSFEVQQNGVKRRHRTPTSCFACRRKKVKCDKKKPYCGGCLTNEDTTYCTYELQPWQKEKTDVTRDNEISMLRMKVKKLEETILKQSQALKNHSTVPDTPLSISTKSSNDPTTASLADSEEMLNVRKNFEGYTVKDSKLSYFGPTSYVTGLLDDKYTSLIFVDYSLDQICNFNEFSERTDLEGCEAIPEKMSVLKQEYANIAKYLPNMRLIDLLIDTFFRKCYHLAPFVDEDNFKKEIKLLLIDKGSKVEFSTAVLGKQSTVSLLLIVLRFAYASFMFSGVDLTSSPDYYAVAELKSSSLDLPSSILEYAIQLIFGRNTIRRFTLRTLQALLVLRIYKFYCPEDDDGLVDSGVLQTAFIQMARYRGMNRDPCEFPSGIISSDGIHLWKKIWCQMVYLDANQAFQLGSNYTLQDYEIRPLNIESADDIKGEDRPSIARFLALLYKITPSLRNAINALRDGNTGNKAEVLNSLNELNDVLYNQTRTFSQLSNVKGMPFDSNTVDRVQEFAFRIDLYSKTHNLNFILFTSAELRKEHEESTKFLSLALENAIIIMKNAVVYSEDPSLLFGPEFGSFIGSVIFQMTVKVMSSICTVIFRIIKEGFSLSEATKYFKSPDAAGLVSWLNLDYMNQDNNLKTLVSKVEDLYFKAKTYSEEIFTCYKLAVTISAVLIELEKTSPHLITKFKSSGQSKKSTERLLDEDLLRLTDLWNTRQGITSEDFEQSATMYDAFSPPIV